MAGGGDDRPLVSNGSPNSAADDQSPLDHSDHATPTTRTDNVSGKSQAFPGGSQGSAAHLSLSFSVDFGMFDPLPPTSKINHFGLRPVYDHFATRRRPFWLLVPLPVVVQTSCFRAFPQARGLLVEPGRVIAGLAATALETACRKRRADIAFYGAFRAIPGIIDTSRR
jgi:hypothetical protein